MFGKEAKTERPADSRASKRMAVNADASLKTVQSQAEMALKLAVICTQKQREMESIIGSSVQLKKAGKVNTAMLAAHSEYLKRAKGQKGHGLGDGSTFRFGAVILTITEGLEPGEDKDKFAKMVQDYDPTCKQSLRRIKFCKSEVMHSSELVRFKLSIPSDFECASMIIDAIEKLESTTCWVGPRPAGYLEAEGQKIISGTSSA